MPDISKKIQGLINDGKIEEAFNESYAFLKHIDKDYFYHLSDLSIIYSNYHYLIKRQKIEIILKPQDFEIEKNRIVYSLLNLLEELQIEKDLKSQIETNVAISEIGKAIRFLLRAASGTKYYKEVLLLSSRYFAIQKKSGNIDKKEIEDIKYQIGLNYKNLIKVNRPESILLKKRIPLMIFRVCSYIKDELRWKILELLN